MVETNNTELRGELEGGGERNARESVADGVAPNKLPCGSYKMGKSLREYEVVIPIDR
jgi:hypothetical protein